MEVLVANEKGGVSVMDVKPLALRIPPRLITYKLARMGLPVRGPFLTLTHSVTRACQSRCKTCHIGSRYLESPESPKEDLSLREIEKIYKSIGSICFYNISGGEPFLRKDLPAIVELAMRHLKPNIIHVPTNAILSHQIREATAEILEMIREYDPGVTLSVKPSIDGIGDDHDEIRGVKGNFEKLRMTIELLKEVERKHRNFQLELGTVVSVFNAGNLHKIENFVHSLGVQSYRNEIAACREEFFNLDEGITPDAGTYEELMKTFKEKVIGEIRAKKSMTRITETLRLVYYDLVPKILRRKEQVIPCYAGISNIHLNYDGELWPCCVLGYARPMGHLREYDFDFTGLYRSERAKEVLRYIKEKNCYCSLANQSYSNMLLHFGSLAKLMDLYLRYMR